MAQQQQQPQGRNMERCIGQCGASENEYSHDYLHCPQCKVKPVLCSIAGCPCGGNGVLIPTAEKALYSHQMLHHNKSVRVYLTRKSKAVERVEKLMRKLDAPTSSSDRGESSTKRSRADFEDEGDEEEAASAKKQTTQAASSTLVDPIVDIPLNEAADLALEALDEFFGLPF
jgi:hypothetical protein